MAIQPEFIFDLGDKVKDVISGYEGIIVGRFEFLTGCSHYGVEGAYKEGSEVPYQSIDEQRLELVEAQAKQLARDYNDPVSLLPAERTSPGPAAPRSPQRTPRQ